MIFFRNNVNIQFKTKRTPHIMCGLGESFYVLVYGDYTVMYGSTTHKLCFPIPVHYPSFILTLSGRITRNVSDYFIFMKEEDKEMFEEYVSSLNMEGASIISEFEVKKIPFTIINKYKKTGNRNK